MELKGITWDHARGYNPLIPVSAEFCKAHPGVEISWMKRSLKDFEDFPVSRLAEMYDMIMIDHPYMTAGSRAGFLLDLSSLIEPSYFDMLVKDTVGPSLESYCVNGHYYGLPVDAAAQVAAENAPVLAALGMETPRTVEEAIRLSGRIGKARFALPLVPTHLFSTFMSLTAQCSDSSYFNPDTGIRTGAAEQAADLLYRLIAVSNPVSFQRDPITLLDDMSRSDEIVYSPFIYGYVNYSRVGYAPHLITFVDAPLVRLDAAASTQIGGVGISLTKHLTVEQLPAAVEFAKYLASPEVQRGTYTQADGQPASRAAWLDEGNNRLTNNFFKNTIRTLDKGFLRPKTAFWNEFQEAASHQLYRQVESGLPPAELVAAFNDLYADMRAKEDRI